MSGDLLERLAGAVASGRLVAPPITVVELRDGPLLWHDAGGGRAVKPVIVP